MIIDKAYAGTIPESHLMIEITPEVLRDIACRLEERAKSSQRNHVLTVKLTREVTLTFQVEDKYNGISITSAKEETPTASSGGEVIDSHILKNGARHWQEETS